MNSIKKFLAFIALGLLLTADTLTAAGKRRVLINRIIDDYTRNKSHKAHASTFGFNVSTQSCPTLYQLVTQGATKLAISTPHIKILQGNSIANLLAKLGIYNIKNEIFALSLTSNISFIFIGEQILTGHEGSTGDRLYDDELEALLAHELSHIYHNHSIKKLGLYAACTALTGFLGYSKTLMPQTASKFFDTLTTEILTKKNPKPTPVKSFNSWTGIASFASSVIGLNAYSRHCERQADKTATTIINNPSSLARSLDKVRAIKQNQGNWSTWMSSWFSTHPPLGERKKNLEQIKVANNNKKDDRVIREEEQRKQNKERIKEILK